MLAPQKAMLLCGVAGVSAPLSGMDQVVPVIRRDKNDLAILSI